MADLFGGIEAGGTKFVCGVGSSPDDLQTVRIDTGTPAETLSQVLAFFTPFSDRLRAIGVGSFGPIDINPLSPTYGFITSTPKLAWANVDLLGTLQQALDLPFAFDTDVNAAALGELRWGAAEGLDDFVYITVGTGVGGGVVCNGQLVHGVLHTELGHVFLPKHPEDDYRGKCPFHADRCLEGLASGPAITERWGAASSALAPEHRAWDIQAWYLGAAIGSFVCAYSPQRIIMGGGVMSMCHLLEKTRESVLNHLNGYLRVKSIVENIDSYIVEPGLGGRAGVLGALELARLKVR